MSDLVTYTLSDEEATRKLGAVIAGLDPVPDMIFLRGELGSGKTTLVRGLLQAMGHDGPVRSPTYTLIESYEVGEYSIHHLDLYRLTDPEELDYLGVRDLSGILLIEWPERAHGLLGDARLDIRLDYSGRQRRASFTPLSDALSNALKQYGYESDAYCDV